MVSAESAVSEREDSTERVNEMGDGARGCRGGLVRVWRDGAVEERREKSEVLEAIDEEEGK